MKHCIIRHSQLTTITKDILALSKAGVQSLWTFKKSQGQWMATSTRPIALSLAQLERAVA